jgi:NodT family efflux transporter outer membrane factor (OMF) lipoprotein
MMLPTRHLRYVGLVSTVVMLSACSFAPHYQVPAAPQAEIYKEAAPVAAVDADAWTPANPGDSKSRGAWWTVFADPDLDALEQRAFAANQNFAAAAARYRQARAAADAAKTQIFPLVGIAGFAEREQLSKNAPGSTVVGKPLTRSDHVLQAQTSYELDFWGRVRNTIAAAKGRAQASAADLATALLSIQSELASNYIALRGLDSQIVLLETTVDAYSRAVDITRNRYEGGAAAVVDVDQAVTQFETARALLANTRLARAQLEHAIAILVGETPTNFTLAPASLTMTPPAVNVGLPSQLLERRPDVASAERQVFAANAEIGIARAAWFPTFSLNAAYGYQSAHADTWLAASSQFWSAGPAMAVDALDWGRRMAQDDRARGAYEETVATYRQIVIQAFGEVEDQLAAVHWLDTQLDAQERAVVSSQRSLDQANYRYKGGLVTYLEVVSAQNTALQAQQTALSLKTRRLVASVQLIKALGGDWSPEQLKAPLRPGKNPANVAAQQAVP